MPGIESEVTAMAGPHEFGSLTDAHVYLYFWLTASAGTLPYVTHNGGKRLVLQLVLGKQAQLPFACNMSTFPFE